MAKDYQGFKWLELIDGYQVSEAVSLPYFIYALDSSVKMISKS